MPTWTRPNALLKINNIVLRDHSLAISPLLRAKLRGSCVSITISGDPTNIYSPFPGYQLNYSIIVPSKLLCIHFASAAIPIFCATSNVDIQMFHNAPAPFTPTLIYYMLFVLTDQPRGLTYYSCETCFVKCSTNRPIALSKYGDRSTFLSFCELQKIFAYAPHTTMCSSVMYVFNTIIVRCWTDTKMRGHIIS